MDGSLVSVLADHVISVLIEKVFEEISLATRHRKDLEFICDELESIKCLLNDTGGAWKTNSSSVRNWLQKLEDFLYDTLHLLGDSSQAHHHTTCISRYLLGPKIRALKERILCIHRSSKYLKYLTDMDMNPRPGLVSGKLIRNRRKSKLPEYEKQSHLSVEEVRDNIRRHLQGSRCLLVLDDALGSIGGQE
ncbi:hypothetical protein SUGI_0063040 [Cryptomeria japonica]|nr:hypothetical protein SUGI_0063040 [Cryptomeria japonica]